MIVEGEEYHKEILTGSRRRKHRRQIEQALKQHGADVTRELERVVSTGTRSGRVYFYRGRAHQASAPGEPPAKRSGRLARSFESRPRTYDMVIGSTAFSDRGAPYPIFLEKGTRKMEPRPYFLKTIESKHRDLIRELENGRVLS